MPFDNRTFGTQTPKSLPTKCQITTAQCQLTEMPVTFWARIVKLKSHGSRFHNNSSCTGTNHWQRCGKTVQRNHAHAVKMHTVRVAWCKKDLTRTLLLTSEMAHRLHRHISSQATGAVVLPGREELARYKALQVPSAYNSPPIFWHEHRQDFPVLSKVARRVLCISASYAQSEWLFLCWPHHHWH